MKEKRNKLQTPRTGSSEDKPSRKRSAFNENKGLSSHPKKVPEKDDVRIENHETPPGLPEDAAKGTTRSNL